MSFKKGDIITAGCGCIGVFDHKVRSKSRVSIFLYKCGSEAPYVINCYTNFVNSRLSTTEEINEFKKALIKDKKYYCESDKTIKSLTDEF